MTVIVIRTHPDSRRAPVENFTGTVYVDELAIAEPPSRLRAFSVHLTPGARSAWHQHPLGQILHVTEGEGRVQVQGAAVGAQYGGTLEQRCASGVDEWV